MNPDQLQRVKNPDPIVLKKLLIRLHRLKPPFSNSVINDVATYLAVLLLQPQILKVCKCMKTELVQCELWNQEILRHWTRPSCTCKQGRLPDPPDAIPSATHIEFKECSSVAAYGKDGHPKPCPGSHPRLQPCPALANTYVMQTEPRFAPARGLRLTRLRSAPTTSRTPGEHLATNFLTKGLTYSDTKMVTDPKQSQQISSTTASVKPTSSIYITCRTVTAATSNSSLQFSPSPWSMFARAQGPQSTVISTPSDAEHLSKISDKRENSPAVTTDQMSDLYAMIVSLTWNMQAWRGWLQEKFDCALSHVVDPKKPPDEAYAEWVEFQKRVMKEALQWRQYIKFSQQLIKRLQYRYEDKEIVSPTRASNKTRAYLDCQTEMFEITDKLTKWTQWLVAVLKVSEVLRPSDAKDEPLHVMCWNLFKEEVKASLLDWRSYKLHLTICWEHRYRTLMAAWEQEGPVWVMSACGAVPSGAVSAGKYNDEVIWVARATHKSEVLPAALLPSKHCCLVYADGAIHCYTKYQVLCNADVQWVAWRGRERCEAAARAVCVAPGVHVGRVEYRCSHYLVGPVLAPNYRCHVVIRGNPFAFECFELLVLSHDDEVTGYVSRCGSLSPMH